MVELGLLGFLMETSIRIIDTGSSIIKGFVLGYVAGRERGL